MNRLSILLIALLPLAAEAQDTTTVKGQQLQEVIVNANNAQRRIGSVQIGAEQIQMKELTSAPALFGEVDVMRSLQLLPGVKAESDASSSFQVRGGTAAQNNILYDEAPVYNIGHLAGLSLLSTTTLWLRQPFTRDWYLPSTEGLLPPCSISLVAQVALIVGEAMSA